MNIGRSAIAPLPSLEAGIPRDETPGLTKAGRFASAAWCRDRMAYKRHKPGIKFDDTDEELW